MRKVIAIVNQKGGTGKTTTTANLAFALAAARRRILCVDADPQLDFATFRGRLPLERRAPERV